jgi:rubrerythrin
MHDMTAGNLRSAFGGESMAHMRYDVWGKKAERDGFKNVARLFKAVSYAETIHASGHFNELRGVGGAFLVNSMAGFGIGSTSENLAGAIDGETFEINEMYPVYLNDAVFQGEKGAERSFNYAFSAEKTHAALYQRAKDSVDAGKDMGLSAVQVCAVCGYTLEGEAPDVCPICKAKKEKFVAFA